MSSSQDTCVFQPSPVSAAQIVFFMIFGRTDLRIVVSGAKFDARSDFEVRLAIAPQKPSQNSEKLIIRKFSFRFGVFSDFKRRIELKLWQPTDLELADVLIYEL